MSQSLDEEPMEVSNDNDFGGFTDEDIELSTHKAHKFTFFLNDWMADFNVDALWTGRNYKNMQVSLQSQADYTTGARSLSACVVVGLLILDTIIGKATNISAW